ncbi:hypothetical protein Acr_00g0081860 [Actinidia rufa]|uniref:Uncharacterized protein n=1 Tax=Actinidia rufa TaxID=165716 RepID=A0A7J0DUL0_9ERIC|nr:hypothetical protein Acr_00g0081860 [Actinidia rufa]
MSPPCCDTNRTTATPPSPSSQAQLIALPPLQIGEPSYLAQRTKFSNFGNRTISKWINAGDVDFDREEEEWEVGSNSSSLGSTFWERDEVALTEEEEKEKEEEEEENEGDGEEEEEEEKLLRMIRVKPGVLQEKEQAALPTAEFESSHHGTDVSLVTSSPSAQVFSPELSIRELGRRVTHDDTSQDFKTCLAMVQSMMLPRDVAKLQKEDKVMGCPPEIGGKISAREEALEQFKEGLKETTVLDGELKRKEEELTAFTEELNKKDGEIAVLRQVPPGPVYHRVNYRSWNWTDDFYVMMQPRLKLMKNIFQLLQSRWARKAILLNNVKYFNNE